MTVELARRLVDGGVAKADVELALLAAVERRVPFTKALLERRPDLAATLEREAVRGGVAGILTVRPSPELCGRLPEGLCERLLAVPVHQDSRTSRVDIAALEPSDAHVAQEFAFHLRAPVRLLHAPLEAIERAIEWLGAPSGPVSAGALSARSVESPIPLVRRSLPPSERPADGDRASEPVLVLRKPKPSGEPRPAADPGVLPGPDSALLPSLKGLIEAADSPDRVVALLRDALAPAESIVFAVRNRSFEARAASLAVEGRVSTRDLGIPAHLPSVLETAARSGFYLGPLPSTPIHDPLRGALDPELREVYVTVVSISDRPSLLWLIAGSEPALDLTRRADELARAAGRALERIVLTRKQRGG